MPAIHEQLRERVAIWTAPIPGASPAGTPARFLPESEAVASEVAKLDMPAGGAVNWKVVVEGAGAILASRSKDMAMAAYLAQGLFVTRGLDGLTTGATLVSELMALYWDTMQPDVKRLRGRANALQWYVDKVSLALQQDLPQGAKPDEIEALEAAVVMLAESSRERFANLAPAFGGIIDAIARLKDAASSAVPQPPEQELPAEASVRAPPTPAPVEPPPVVTVTAPKPPALPTLTEGADLKQHFGEILIALVDAGRAMRRSDSANPASYRAQRAGLWLAFDSEPQANKKGRTSIPAPEDSWRPEMQQLLAGEQWAELLVKAEGMAVRVPLWLDAQRMSWQALSGLGDSHGAAREAVEAEVKALVVRMPGLPGLSFDDGSTLADNQTRAWIEELVGTVRSARERTEPATPSARDAGDGTAETVPPTDVSRQLLDSGRVEEALAAMRDAIQALGDERQRFRLRLKAARMYWDAGLKTLAKATYEDLDRESQARGLDTWEPQLAADCLGGLIAASLGSGEEPRGAAPGLVASYRRLCRLDPAVAHAVWP